MLRTLESKQFIKILFFYVHANHDLKQDISNFLKLF